MQPPGEDGREQAALLEGPWREFDRAHRLVLLACDAVDPDERVGTQRREFGCRRADAPARRLGGACRSLPDRAAAMEPVRSASFAPVTGVRTKLSAPARAVKCTPFPRRMEIDHALARAVHQADRLVGADRPGGDLHQQRHGDPAGGRGAQDMAARRGVRAEREAAAARGLGVGQLPGAGERPGEIDRGRARRSRPPGGGRIRAREPHGAIDSGPTADCPSRSSRVTPPRPAPHASPLPTLRAAPAAPPE